MALHAGGIFILTLSYFGAVSLLLDRDNNRELSYLLLTAETSEQMARGNKEKLQNIIALQSGS